MNEGELIKIDEIYKNLLTRSDILYKMPSTAYNIKSLEYHHSYIMEMNDKIEKVLKLSKKIGIECKNKAEYMKTEIEYKKTNDDFTSTVLTFRNKYKNATWGDICEEEEKKENLFNKATQFVNCVNKYKTSLIPYKNINSIKGVELGFDYKIPIINKLNEIPPCLYWYNGDKKNEKGVYICLTNGNYIKMPFVNVIDISINEEKVKTIKCKYNTLENCKKNTNINCRFAHVGEKYMRLGTAQRCLALQRFGKHNTLKNDLDKVSDQEIQMLLINSLSDLLLSSIWYQKHNKKKCISNIDTVI